MGKAITVSASDAARGMGDLLGRVRYRGESFLIKRGRAVVAQLGPPPAPGVTGRELARAWREMPHMTSAEALLFDKDVRAFRRAANRPPRDPWAR